VLPDQPCISLGHTHVAVGVGAVTVVSGGVARGVLTVCCVVVLGFVCCAEFKCGIAFDPWWPLLPTNSAALKGWQTNGPLLVLGSQVRVEGLDQWTPAGAGIIGQG
jgi:hypothetical protein